MIMFHFSNKGTGELTDATAMDLALAMAIVGWKDRCFGCLTVHVFLALVMMVALTIQGVGRADLEAGFLAVLTRIEIKRNGWSDGNFDQVGSKSDAGAIAWMDKKVVDADGPQSC